MNHVSVEHLELVMQGMNNLRLRDTRTLYSILRKYSQNGKKDRDRRPRSSQSTAS